MADRVVALKDRSTPVVEFVCLARHKTDPINADGFTVAVQNKLAAYCAGGADQNHEWIRVPPTPLHEITIGKMEDRPPEPVSARDRQHLRGGAVLSR